MYEQQTALVPYLGTWILPNTTTTTDATGQTKTVNWQQIVGAVGGVLQGVSSAFGDNDAIAQQQVAQLQAQMEAEKAAQAAQKRMIMILIVALFGLPVVGLVIYFATR